MRYLGGKYRVSKHIAPILAESLYSKDYFIEPFTGGFNIIPAILNQFTNLQEKTFICSDSDVALISLLRQVQKGWQPKHRITEVEYRWVKENTPEDDPLHGFCAFAMSFGGKKWGGIARDPKSYRDFYKQAVDALAKKQLYMKNVIFLHGYYFNLKPNQNTTTYCDPPYRNTTGYKDNPFDPEHFQSWIQLQQGDKFVSEYRGAYPYREIWSMQKTRDLKSKTEKSATEVLYKVQ